MSAVLERCALAGIRLWLEGPALRYDAPKGAMTPDLIAELKAHKADIVKALKRPPAPKVPRGLGGYTVNGLAPGVPPLQDSVMARQIRGMNEGAALPPADIEIRRAALAHPDPLPPLSAAAYKLIGYFEERLAAVQRYAPTELHMNSRPPTVAAVRDAVTATLAMARARGFAQREVIEALEGYPEAKKFLLAELGQPSAPGVSPGLAARLSAEDLEDIAAGDIPLGTVQQYEQAAIAREAEDLREFLEERVGILEHDALLPRADAELEAAKLTATLARNRSYSWASLRASLADYPVLLAQLPDTEGPLDALPLGLPTLAVRKGKRVVQQGAFTGRQEVKA